MYVHANGRTSTPPSTSVSVSPHSQYHFAAQSGTGLVYDAYAFYSPLSSIPLPVSKSSSSSLAAALIPAPEPEPAPTLNSQSEPTVCTAEQNPRVHAGARMSPHREGDGMPPTNISNPLVMSVRQEFVNPAAFRAQSQMYQGEEMHRHAATQPQASGHFSHSHTQSPSASTLISTTYPHPHQQLAYVQTDEPLWPPDAAFPLYPSTLPFPPTPAPVASPSHFPLFPQDFAFDTMGVSGPALDTYVTGVGMEEWTYAQENTAYPVPEEMYFNFNATSAGAGPWSEPLPFGPQLQIQNRPSTSITAPPISAGAEVEIASVIDSDAVPSQSTAGFDAGTFVRSYFSEQDYSQQQQQRDDQTSSAQGLYALEQRQHQSPAMEQSYAEDNSLIHLQPRQSSPSLQVSSQPVHAKAHSTQPSLAQSPAAPQREPERRQQHQGHNTLMPPPPLPARARTLGSKRQQPRNRTQSTLERRHTVATPPVLSGLIQDGNPSSPAATPSPATGSGRPSIAAPTSFSSSTLRDGPTLEGPENPQMATAFMNDAMWAQSQKQYRHALSESFRLRHGCEPPAEIHIRETSALERSRRNDVVLLGASKEENVGMAEQAQGGETDTGAQAGPESEGAKNSDGTGAPTLSEDMSDEFFSRPLGPDWVPARSGTEIRQEAAPLGAKARSGGSTGSLVSPVSAASTDELVTPRDAHAFFPVRQAQLPYPYVSPANPAVLAAPTSSALLQKVLPLLRHDAHLVPHVSGLGGCCQNAYDGRSYLTDDSELDPVHVPPAPPGARSGDHPALAVFLPHPLAKRGQVWHDLLNPAPESRVPANRQGEREDTEETLSVEKADQRTDVDEDVALKKLEEQGVKKEEKGEGWGFVEGGSHGPEFGLLGGGAINDGVVAGLDNKHSQRLKLSTEKKTPPKMACHFCRNRKIACGPSKCGDASICNQCERRKLRCIFPTISRRGMRTKGQRSAHTIDGTDEADKDSAEYDESLVEDPEDIPSSFDSTEPRPSGSSTGSLTKTGKVRKPREKGVRFKETAKGSRGRGNGKITTSEEDRRVRQSDDVEMNDDTQESRSMTQADRAPGYTDDPLASLAAEMQWQQHLTHASPVSSSAQYDTASSSTFASPSSSFPSSSLSAALDFPSSGSVDVSYSVPISGGNYTLHMGPSSGPFTTSPLPRRSQQESTGGGGGSRS